MKAQMEIFGLAIIMIMLVMALLIFLSFQKPQEKIAENYLMVQIPTKTLQTMMETTTSCQSLSVDVLISNIASMVGNTNGAVCGGVEGNNLQIGCGSFALGQNAYAYEELFDLNKEGVVPKILSRSLGDSFISYDLSIDLEDSCNIYKNSSEDGGCINARRVDAETFILQSDRGKVLVQLRVC